MRTVSETSETKLRYINIYHYRGPKKVEKREMWPGEVFEEIIAPNFPNMRKKTVTQVLYRINPNRKTSRHQVIKLKTLKATREQQQIIYKGGSISLSANLQQKLFRPEESGMIYLK